MKSKTRTRITVNKLFFNIVAEFEMDVETGMPELSVVEEALEKLREQGGAWIESIEVENEPSKGGDNVDNHR